MNFKSVKDRPQHILYYSRVALDTWSCAPPASRSAARLRYDMARAPWTPERRRLRTRGCLRAVERMRGQSWSATASCLERKLRAMVDSLGARVACLAHLGGRREDSAGSCRAPDTPSQCLEHGAGDKPAKARKRGGPCVCAHNATKLIERMRRKTIGERELHVTTKRARNQ